MTWPRFQIRTLMIIVAVVAFASWGWVFLAGMEAGSRHVLLQMPLLLALVLVACLFASVAIVALVFAIAWIGSLLGELVSRAEAAVPTTPEPKD